MNNLVSKSFIKSSFIYSFIGSLPLASSVLLLPFYGNSNLLSTDDFGLLAIYIAFAELVRILFNFSTDNYIGINFIHNAGTREKQQKFIGTATLFMIIFGLGMALMFSVLGDFVFSFVFPGKNVNFYPYGLLSVLTGLFTGIFKSYASLMIYRQRPNPYFWSNMLHFVLAIACSVTGLYMFPMSLDGPIWGRFISALATFIWAIVYFTNVSKLSYSRSVLKDLLSYCAPLYIYYILSWIIANADRYFILGILDQKEVAIFDFAMKMTLLFDFLQGGLAAAINPKVFQIWKKNGDVPQGSIEINKYFNGFTVINQMGMPLAYICFLFFVPLIVNNSDLYASFSLLPVLMAGVATRVWYHYLIAPIYYFKKTKVLPIIFAVVAVFQVVSTILLIKLMDIQGAAWASFLCKVVQVLLVFLFVRRFYKFSVNPQKFILYPIIYIVMLLLTDLFFSNVNQYLMASIHLVVLAVAGFIMFRKEIVPFLKSVFNKTVV